MFKLLTNIVVFVLNIITAGIIPRGLGPTQYGNFTFLTDFFRKIFAFLDTGTSTAFFTKLSQRQNENGIIRFYTKFILIVLFFVILFVFGFSYNTETLWPEQEIKYIWLALFWGFLTWLSQIVSKMVDAYALTAKGEVIRIFQQIFAVSFLLFLFWAKKFSLTNFFIYHFVILILLISAWLVLIVKNGYRLFPKEKASNQETKGYFKEFYTYSGPLIIYALVVLIVGILDRLLLQKYGGSVQQGYFGLSFKISSICLMFTTAMSPLILREFAIAFKNKNIELMRSMFKKYIPLLYVIATYFAVFIFFQADNVSVILGGKNFTNSKMTIAIMALYPIHQTYGQLNGSIFMATSRTKMYRNIGIIFSSIGLLVLFYLISPAENGFGRDLGATGLAIKMVIIQFLSVNVLLWYNCKLMKIPFAKIFIHQLYTILLLGILAWISSFFCKKFIVDYLTLAINKDLFVSIWSFTISGLIYTLLVFGLLWIFPRITFHDRKSLITQYNQIKSTLLNKRQKFFKKS